jgi:hypothetical protein
MTLPRFLFFIVILGCVGLAATDQWGHLGFGLIWLFAGFCLGATFREKH